MRIVIAALLLAGCAGRGSVEDDRLALARKCAAWIESQPPSEKASLYSGSAGVALFQIAMHRATGETRYLELARAAAERMASQNHPDGGLYTGEAGAGLVFLELRDPRAAEIAGRVTWGKGLDVISGAAGIGLFLIRAGRLDRAREAGDFVLGHGPPWLVEVGDKTLYPNFAHGTSGVAFFLAALYSATKDDRYLRSAVAGAEWLQERSQDGAWFHHESGGKELFYAGWCHGPAGTARLFWLLHRITREQRWLDAVHRCATWTLACRRPTAGWWNVSLCCGTAGIGEFMIDLHRATGVAEYRDFAEKLAAELIASATAEGPGLKWIQAEHRVKPKDVAAQTGLMQGAAGIGIFFLKLGGRIELLPDNPF